MQVLVGSVSLISIFILIEKHCAEVEKYAYNCRKKQAQWRFRFMFSTLMFLSHPQIIQTEGSYSFLLCGMIIACIGFIVFIGLLLFHRMHRNYLTGSVSTTTLTHRRWWFAFVRFIIITSHPNPLCIPTGTTKKSAMVEEPATEQNGSARTAQKEEIESSWEGQQLRFVLYWLL